MQIMISKKWRKSKAQQKKNPKHSQQLCYLAEFILHIYSCVASPVGSGGRIGGLVWTAKNAGSDKLSLMLASSSLVVYTLSLCNPICLLAFCCQQGVLQWAVWEVTPVLPVVLFAVWCASPCGQTKPSSPLHDAWSDNNLQKPATNKEKSTEFTWSSFHRGFHVRTVIMNKYCLFRKSGEKHIHLDFRACHFLSLFKLQDNLSSRHMRISSFI